jgi:Sec-independent protein translocase protein TatA
MLGISGMEFLVIVIVAIAVVPAKSWPDVARAVGKTVRYIRNIMGKIQDGIDGLENEMAKDLPIDSLSQKTMDDMVETFSTPIKPRTGKKCKK